jgi:hypothetical protein
MILPDHLLRRGASEEVQVNQTTDHPAAAAAAAAVLLYAVHYFPSSREGQGKI